MEATNEIPVIMENILFVNISARKVGQSKASAIIKPLNILAQQYGYNLSNRIDMICAKRLLTNCVVFN